MDLYQLVYEGARKGKRIILQTESLQMFNRRDRGNGCKMG